MEAFSIPNGLPEERRYIATLATATYREGIQLTDTLMAQWVHEGFVSAQEMQEIYEFYIELANKPQAAA